MRHSILIFFLCACVLPALAQDYYAPDVVYYESEAVEEAVADTAAVVTVADIIKVQQAVTSQHALASHFEKVWGYKSFFNLSVLTSASLKPKHDIPLGYPPINDDKVPRFKADYGLALQLGHNYNLLKNPVANIVNFNIDYTYIDLTMAHYKKEPGEYVFNSDNTWVETDDKGRSYTRKYIPWCLSKYDIFYGMNVGPSVTLAPFTSLPSLGLHFLKFNLYYHIGYQVGILWMVNDKDADAASSSSTSSYYTEPVKVNLGHGLVQSIGFNVSWKTIGLGFETRFDNRTYKAIDTSTYGKEKYKFGGNNSRFYIKISY